MGKCFNERKDVDVVLTFAERVIDEDTLRTWQNNFTGTVTSQTCKGK